MANCFEVGVAATGAMPSVTTSDTLVERVMPFAVPVTLSVYVPVGVTVPDFDVVTESVAELPLVEVELSVAVVPAGAPETDSETGRVKKVRLIPMPKLADWPCFTEPPAASVAAEDRLKFAPNVTFVRSVPL